jgi:hypothetical protein
MAPETVDLQTGAAFPDPAAAVDVPLTATVSAELPAAIFSVAVRLPAAVGLNVTEIVQFAEAATLDPHLLVCEKSPEFAPFIVTAVFESERAALPPLVSVTVRAALALPTAWLLNVNVGGATETEPCASAMRAQVKTADARSVKRKQEFDICDSTV